MCHLGVSMMNNHIYGSKLPKTPTLGAWMRKIQIAISSDLCIRLTWNLTASCGQQQGLRGWSRMVVKPFQDGGRPLFWKSLYRHISAKNHPTSMKFCTQQQILNWMNVTWSKMKKLHWTDSEFDRTYFVYWNRFFSVTLRLILMKLGTNDTWATKLNSGFWISA